MKKMKRLHVFLSMVLCLVMAVSFSACSSGGSSGSGSGGASNASSGGAADAAGSGGGDAVGGAYTIGHAQLGPDWIMVEYQRLMDVEMKVENPAGKLEYSLCDFQSDKMQNSIQSFIGNGADAINWYAIFAALTPTILKMCEDANVPMGIGHIPPLPEQYEALLASPIFTGYVGGDLYFAGYQLGELAAKNGGTKAIIEIGVPGTFDMESKRQGFTDGFEANGGKVLEYVSASTPAEALPKSTDMLNAHPDADVAYAGTGFHCVGLMTAVSNLNRQDTVKVYSSDLDLDLMEPVRTGAIVAGDAGSQVEMILANALTLNWLDGHPILDENGKPPILDNLHNCLVTKDNIDKIEEIFVDGDCFSPEMMKHFLYAYNPDVSYADFQDFADNYDYEWFLEFRKSFGLE
jgi:ABC-type sugar transport system substrate-binding protein